MNNALITPAELKRLLESGDEKISLLDATYAIGMGGHAPHDIFLHMRIGQAQFFDIDAIADHDNPLPHMLPSPEQFAYEVGKLGVANDHLVVVYDQGGIAMAACRAWWMFRVFGHDNVRVLDGGLPAWSNRGFALEQGAPQETERQTFHAQFRPHLLSTYDQIRSAVEQQDAVILDARPAERFAGLTDEPRPGLSAGHMPGARSVPAGSLIDPRTRGMLPPAELRARLGPLNLNNDSPIITTCGSGVTACVTALALFNQGYENVAVYDGSWSEWARQELDSPIVKGIE